MQDQQRRRLLWAWPTERRREAAHIAKRHWFHSESSPHFGISVEPNTRMQHFLRLGSHNLWRAFFRLNHICTILNNSNSFDNLKIILWPIQLGVWRGVGPKTGSDFYYAIISGRYSQLSAQPLRSIDRPIESFASNSFPSSSFPSQESYMPLLGLEQLGTGLVNIHHTDMSKKLKDRLRDPTL